jgi:peptide/nickel transport system ATP-binding protein
VTVALEVEIESLALRRRSGARVTLVEDVAFSVADGGSLGIVGESGSGKSLLALTIMGLLPPGIAARGRVGLDGIDLIGLDEGGLEAVRGARVGMIFQEPMTALNPAMRVGDQIAEGLIRHKGLDRGQASAEALRLLDRVRIPEARRRLAAYPHELSGGQRQRVGIAMAIAPGPGLLVADEPTTALDVTVQADILDLLAELVADLGMSLILISHDFGVIAASCDRTLVLYAGTAVESGPTGRVLRSPGHPYTRALLAALPRPAEGRGKPRQRLKTIPGTVPVPGSWPPGCHFAPRCDHARAGCGDLDRRWRPVGGGAQAVRCVLAAPAR